MKSFKNSFMKEIDSHNEEVSKYSVEFQVNK